MITIDDIKANGIKKTQPVKVVAKEEVTQEVIQEVVKVVEAVPTVLANDQVLKMTPMQKAVYSGMKASMATQAQTTIATEFEVTSLEKIYKQIKDKYKNAGVKLSYTAMIVKAVAMALENHEKMRTSVYDENHLKISANINIGIAVDVSDGLIVPVVKDANIKDLRTICLEILELSSKAKENRLKPEEMENGLMTITNLGMFGVTYFTPVCNLKESSILGVGAMTEKVLAKDGAFYLGSVMNLSLTIDNRAINGAPEARFLQEVVSNLQNYNWL